MKVHAISSQPQFWRHIRPVYEALPPDWQGKVVNSPRPRLGDLPPDDAVLVGGSGNITLAEGRRVIYVEHGAGQTYSDVRSKSAENYPGGLHPDNVIGYLCPNETVAATWHRPSVVVGCPALSGVHAGLGDRVVFTFHWDAVLVSHEARSALPHYYEQLPEILDWVRRSGDGWLTPLGHWHPRDPKTENLWKWLGVECEPDPDRALERAALVIADNTSFAYEATALGIPCVALNAPWYRRDVHHGLRFWDHPPGLMVDDPHQLMSRPVTAWIEDPVNRTIKWTAANRAYGTTPPTLGAARGAEFITTLLG